MTAHVWDHGHVDGARRTGGPGRASPGAPLVVAHRGSSQAEPEHTLAAYLRAVEEGADGVECDVRLTADDHLVCVHDRTVARTSNGKGVISTLELAELEGLDWGSWQRGPTLGGGVQPTEEPDTVESASQVDTDADRRRILTLRRLVTTLLEAGRPTRLLVETKHPTRYAGMVERRLALLLEEFGLDRPGSTCVDVAVMSFSHLAVQRVRQLCPQVPVVLLLKESVPLLYRGGQLPRGVNIVGLDVRIVRSWPQTVRQQHARGHGVYVWTVDEPDDIARCLDLGVEAIITNRPRNVIDSIASFG